MDKLRIAIIDENLCKPAKCNKECKSVCPVERVGKECIDIEDVAKVYEKMCIGCGMCVKVCPFGAVTIINLPKELEKSLICHRYGENSFRLYKLPQLRKGNVMGIIGQNGIGKTTIVGILGNKIKPNFEEGDLDTKTIIKKFRGTEIQKYLTDLYDSKLKISIKPQNIDAKIKILKSKKIQMSVIELINNELGELTDKINAAIHLLDLSHIMQNSVLTLSGGELQRLLCMICAMRDANVYIFDEPTNYLDVTQRLKVAELINQVNSSDTYVILIEHDMAILDYISDNLTIMYGKPGIYGVASMPFGTSEGINSYFSGFIRGENMRFRDYEYDFKMGEGIDLALLDSKHTMSYEPFELKYDNFALSVDGGELPLESSITVLLGENGSGKTSFLSHIKQTLGYTISHKPQYLDFSEFMKKDLTYPTVEELFFSVIRLKYIDDQFKSDVVRPMSIDKILSRKLDELSGGELQKIFIILCLGRDAHIYLIDEPSANLDIEQRINVTKMIKRFMLHNRKICFIVEHDMMMAVTLAQEYTSRVIVFEKVSLRTFKASVPLESKDGINKFLKIMSITFRTESYNSKSSRPRINKLNSTKDVEQKAASQYYN